MSKLNMSRAERNGKSDAGTEATVTDAARDYFERKWKPLPIERGEKAPKYKGWPTDPTTLGDFRPGINIGVQLGKCSGGLTDIDLDCIEAITLAQYILPKSNAVFGRKSKPRSHYLYVTKLWKTETKAAEKYCDPTKNPSEGAVLVELRTGGQGKGAVTVVPPSRHISKEYVRWDDSGHPELVNGPDLKQDVADLAAAALLVRYYPTSGLRQEGALALGGALARANWGAKEIERFVTAVAQTAGDEEWQKRIDSAKGAIDALKEDRNVYGLPKMRELWGDRIVDSVADWLGLGKGSNGQVVLQADDPVTCAKEFLKHDFHLAGDICTLCFYRGNFYRWIGTHYVETDAKEVRSKLYAFLDSSFTMRGQTMGPFRPTKTKVNLVLDALESGILQPRENDAPFWIGKHENEDLDLIACRNGLLNATTREFVPHTPSLFNVNCLPFDYDPDAPVPKQWLKFLKELWPGGDDGEQARDTLQEIFGLMVVYDTRFQKIFLIIGALRSGKGTIARVMTALLGSDNVAHPTQAGISETFGLSGLIDKRAAIIADARFGTHTNTVVERLLSISGEDRIMINRKNLPYWNGKLGVRFLILTNELPNIADASGALVSRFVALMLTKSFLGKEDLELTDKLLTELPGILNWSLKGLDRLRKYRCFQMPKSSLDKICQLYDLASPVSAFIREWGVEGAEEKIGKKTLFDAYARWCGVEGIKPGSQSVFGKNLNAAVPLVKVRKNGNERFYAGVGLSTFGRKQFDLENEKKKESRR